MIDGAYREGQIPPFEYVDPSMILSLPVTTTEFPLWLSADVRCKIERLYDQGRYLDPCPSCFVGRDSEGNYRAIAYVRITEATAVRSRTAMRNQQFPVPTCDVLGAIVVHDLYQKVMDVLQKLDSPIPIEELATELDHFRERFEMVSSSTYGGPPASR